MNARAGLETRQIESARVSVVTVGPENRQKQCGPCRDGMPTVQDSAFGEGGAIGMVRYISGTMHFAGGVHFG